ncbi:ABC transporter permease [Nonomuraea thailandensis]
MTSTASEPATARPDRADATARRLSLLNVAFELRAFIALAVLVVVFGVLSDAFLTVPNLITMTKHVAINAVIALGMLLVILKGGIDLSVGSIVGLSGVVAGELLGGLHVGGVIAYPPVWVVIVSCVGVGMAVGAVNGVLVTRFNVAPFIATLGMLYVARGAPCSSPTAPPIPTWRATPPSATPASACSAAAGRSACPPPSGS